MPSFVAVPLKDGQRSTYPVGIVIDNPSDFTLSQKPNCVVSLDPTSRSASHGLKLGDTIVSVNNSSVIHCSPDELTTLLEKATASGPVTARIARYGNLDFCMQNMLS